MDALTPCLRVTNSLSLSSPLSRSDSSEGLGGNMSPAVSYIGQGEGAFTRSGPALAQ